MKIRIKNLPKAKKGGLFNNLPWAGSKSTNPLGSINTDVTNLDKTYNDAIKAVDKEHANVEAEKGEVLFKFDAGGIFRINGKTHAEGGTPLKVEQGDFIFSNDKALAITKGEAEKFDLSHSDKGKKNNTPAKILSKEVDLKQYNKFIATLLDPKSDVIAKRTAMLMLEKYGEKIGQIGYLQEGKKGFPQGMPGFSKGTAPVHADEINEAIETAPQYAKYGGWVKVQSGGIPRPGWMDLIDPIKKTQPAQAIQVDPFLPIAGDNTNAGQIGSSSIPRPNNSNWGLWQGDNLPVFKNRYGVNNAADKLGDLDETASRLGYTGPKDNLSFQKWLYNSSPENKAIIDKWHGTYNQGPTNGMFDGKLGIRWAEAMREMTRPGRTTNIPFERQPLPPFTPTVNTNRTNVVPPKQVPEYPFQGYNIGMNGQEVLSGIMPYLSALSLPSHYDMLTQKYSPNLKLDRLNNTQEINNIQQQSSLAQREMFANLPGSTAALASADVRGNEAQAMYSSNARVDQGNTQIANQESMTNYNTDQQDNLFNLQNVHQTYNNNELTKQRRQEQLMNGTMGSLNNFMAIQNNLDTMNQQATAAVMPYLSLQDSVDSNGNPIKVQVPPITFNRNRIPVPTGFGSLDSAGVNAIASTPDTDDYKSAYEYFLKQGVSPDKAAQAATIIFYGRNGQKNASSMASGSANPYAAMLSGMYKF